MISQFPEYQKLHDEFLKIKQDVEKTDGSSEEILTIARRLSKLGDEAYSYGNSTTFNSRQRKELQNKHNLTRRGISLLLAERASAYYTLSIEACELRDKCIQVLVERGVPSKQITM